MVFNSRFLKKYLVSISILIIFSTSDNPSLYAQIPGNDMISTFSIVARDSATGELGVAVASRFFAVGAVVPWAKAGVGAVATQSFANTTFGWRGLELLGKGASPEEAIEILIRNDDDPERRQIGIVSSDGKSATYSGVKCLS